MSASRQKDSSDFDLDQFVRMFDQAMTSQDPRVIDALRGLLVIVTLTQPQTPRTIERGPLRRLLDVLAHDVTNLNRRLGVVENQVQGDQNIFTSKHAGTRFGQIEGRLYPNEVWANQAAQLQATATHKENAIIT